ncbi:MAG: SprT-like domain-containing protein [Patescibacteria group bacterium]
MNLLNAKTLATQLFCKHNLKGWQFKFDRSRRRFGCCNLTLKAISLSRILTELNSPSLVRDTLLHEIAHALTGRRGVAHGREWQDIARSLGCRAKRCYKEGEVKTPPAKYAARCVSCGRSFPAFRRRQRVACGLCCKEKNGGRYSHEFRVVFEPLGL